MAKFWAICPCYRGADKSLARPGRKQANVSVRMAQISFGTLPCRKRNLMMAHVSILLKSRASLTRFWACFIPGRAKDLSVPWYYLSEGIEEDQEKPVRCNTRKIDKHYAVLTGLVAVHAHLFRSSSNTVCRYICSSGIGPFGLGGSATLAGITGGTNCCCGCCCGYTCWGW